MSMFLDGGQLGFNQVIIRTTRDDIQAAMREAKKISRIRREKMIEEMYMEIVKYSSEQVDEMIERKNCRWRDFCADIFLYYIFSNVHYGSNIPMV